MKKLLKLFFNSLRLIIGRPNNMIFITGKIIVAHNHPNGSSEISGSDFLVTNRMNELSRLIDIDLTQHFIIGRESYDTAIDIFEDNEYKDIEEDEEDEEMPFQ